MNKLANEFAETIASGLLRKSVKTCSRWAERYRVMGGQFAGPWKFDMHPWARAMHDSTAPFNVGMKSAQMAYTETLMNRTFFKMDIEGVNCLYALPNKTPDASDFSASRFDPALELSEHLRRIFSDVKNIGHKRAGAANLWIRGSKSRVGFKSIDPSFVVLDEVDEMCQENIPLALRRTDGQLVSQVWAISTPTVPEYGIHGMFMQSSQESFYFTCPVCWKTITLTFPECFVLIGESLLDPRLKESHVICPLCKKKIEQKDKIKSLRETGHWIAKEPAITERRGFYINQLASCVKTPDRIAITAIEAVTNPSSEQELWNSIAGLPHVVAGGRVEDHHITACQRTSRRMDDPIPSHLKIRTMGVDVGKWLHWVILGWTIPKYSNDLNFTAEGELIRCGKVERFSQLIELMKGNQVFYTVIDKQPEERAVYDLCCQFWGRVKRCSYTRGIGSKKMVVSASEEDHLISVSRTFWLDTSLGRVKSNRIILPIDIPGEFNQHLKNVVKKYKTSDDNTDQDDIATYIKVGPDHFTHALTYAEMGLPLAASMATSQNIRSFL